MSYRIFVDGEEIKKPKDFPDQNIQSPENKKQHKCKIGILQFFESSELATLDNLKEFIQEQIRYNEFIEKDPVFKNCKDVKRIIHSLSDYGDWRKNTNLVRFKYCPECGKKIDWKAIKNSAEI